MNIKKIAVYFIVILLLFQESISRFLNLEFLDYLDEIITVVLLFISTIEIIREKKINKTSFVITLLVILFSLIGQLSYYINSEYEVIKGLLSNFLSIKFFLIIIALANINLKDETKEYIFKALEFSCRIVIVIAVFNFVMPDLYSKIFQFAMVTYRFGMVSVTSLFYHTGRYGWFMLFMALLYYSKYKINQNKKDKIWMIVCALFSLLSFRTKVIISLVAIILYEIIFSKKIRVKQLLIGSAILLLIGILFKDTIINTYNLYFTDSKGTSARQALNINSIKIMKEYFPLGVGFGKFGSWYARVYYSEYYYKYNMNIIYGLEPPEAIFATDTFWPSIFGETGVLGSIIYIYILIYIYKTLKMKYKNENGISKEYSLLGILSLIQTLCESMGEQSFNSPPQYIFVALIIGIAIINNKQKELKE